VRRKLPDTLIARVLHALDLNATKPCLARINSSASR